MSPLLTSAPRTEAGEGRSTPKPPVRLIRAGLHERAPGNLRRHVQRAVLRVVVLLFADLAAFACMRALVRAVRDLGALGDGVAQMLQRVLPSGILNGWQFAAAIVVSLMVTGNYGAGDNRRDPTRLLLGCALAAALPLWMTLWTRGLEWVALHYALTVGLVWAGLLTERYVVDRLVGIVRRPVRHAAETVLVGRAADCHAVAASPALAEGNEFRQIGFVDVARPTAHGSVGHIDDFHLLLGALGAEVVVVCGPLPEGAFQAVADATRMAGCRLLSAPRTWSLSGLEPRVLWKSGYPLVELSPPAVQPHALLLKRATDIVLASFGIVLLAPLILLAGLLIKLDSRGPVFYRSKRWGRWGRVIGIWKFRTMVDGAARLLDDSPGLRVAYQQNIKLHADPRVTRIGRFLRRWSLDELPQLFNVLAGEMSLVGPRPKLIGEEARYGAQFDIVVSVPPGMTGLWQVSGRSERSYDERIGLDVEYVRCCSLWLDLRILIQTIPAAIRGTGAV